tara:strand:+ start:86 stop:523 length:438 start_codon:yes stop_codon:yes gene_type:complete
MPAKGFQLIAIEAKRHRKSAPQKQVRIDHNTTILSVNKKSNNEMIVELRYTVSYGLLGIVQLDCEIVYVDDQNIETAVRKWESEHKLPDNIAEAVHNRALAQGSFEVLNIAKKMNLPPPFKVEIPQIKIGKKNAKGNKDSSPEVA